MKKWHIFFIMGVSGAWKWTLIKNLKKQNLDIYIPLSYKTRAKREFETNWVDAYFISKEDFKKAIKNNEFLEYAIVHQKEYYGTKYKDVIENWINKWKIVIKEIDIIWLKKLLKEKAELKKYFTTIFLNISIDKLVERIKKRWEQISSEDLEIRKNSAKIEQQEATKYCDYIINADKSEEEVLQEVLKIINNKKNP